MTPMTDEKAEARIPELSIGEIAELFDIAPSAVRYYEKRGLISPPRKQDSDYRSYPLSTFFELSDIMIYRKMHMHIRDISSMLHTPLAEIQPDLDLCAKDVERQIADLRKALLEIGLYAARYGEYSRLVRLGYNPVDVVGVPYIVKWDLLSSKRAIKRLVNQSAKDSILPAFVIEDMGRPDISVEGLAPANDRTEAAPAETVWVREPAGGTYIECLTRYEYASTKSPDILRHIEHVQGQGRTPYFMVGRYLLSGNEETDGPRYDFYHTWIRVS